MKYIVALDQGTTSSRAVVFDDQARIVAAHNIEFQQIYPHPGWVEHRPQDILDSQINSLKLAVEKAKIDPADIAAIGITNQRETTLLWDRATGEPLCNAIVWQCRRTAPLVERLKQDGLGNVLRDRTGLVPDAYFSGTKLQWMLDTVPGARERAERGELCFGTVDCFLAWHLTANHVHVTDATNAARTMLYNIYEQRWDETLLKAMDIPAPLLPRVVDSSQVVGMLDKAILGREIPIAAMAGDQHAALFGQGCFAPGMCKNTYGTGCFVLMNTGNSPVRSTHNLITTIGWRVDGKPSYALEGSVFVGGAVVQWLRDEIKLVSTAAETEAVATSGARQQRRVLRARLHRPGRAPLGHVQPGHAGGPDPRREPRAHRPGGAGVHRLPVRGRDRRHGERRRHEDRHAARGRRRQRQQLPDAVPGGHPERQRAAPRVIETTAMGAAMLAGRAVGLWTDGDLQRLQATDREFTPQMGEVERRHLTHMWRKAVERSRSWAEEE